MTHCVENLHNEFATLCWVKKCRLLIAHVVYTYIYTYLLYPFIKILVNTIMNNINV